MRGMIWLYRYFFGRLALRFYGEFPERILNLCAMNGITLWNSKFVNDGISANITVRDFYNLRDIMRGTGIRLHIQDKNGLPFLVSRYKKRPGLLVGAMIFMLILEILSGFIWMIDVEGNETVKQNEIISACEKIGIKTGMRAAVINSKSQREKLLLEMDSLSWAALNIEGSRLTVNVSEAKKEKVKENQPCNLKAEFDGIIKKIDVTAGNCVVKVGDAVKKGDVLVSGIIETVGGTRFVRSAGTVTAQVENSYTLEEKYEKKVLSETGRVKTKYVSELFNIKIPLFLGAETDTYNEISDVSQIKLFGKYLPIKLYKKQFRFTEEITLKRDENRLKSELEKQMEEIIKEEKTENYEIIKKEYIKTDEGISLRFTVSLRRNIAYSDFLLINTGN